MGVTPQVLFWNFLFFQMNYNFEGIKIFQWNGSDGRRGRCHSLDRPAALPETGARPIVRFLWKTIFGCFGRTQKKSLSTRSPPIRCLLSALLAFDLCPLLCPIIKGKLFHFQPNFVPFVYSVTFSRIFAIFFKLNFMKFKFILYWTNFLNRILHFINF